MIGRCETCKWWEVSGVIGGVCVLTIVSAQPLHPQSKAKAAAFGGVVYHLRTEPDFGCVQHELKDTTS